jgi:hypothetical protein
MSKCELCPLAGVCPGQRNKRICELVDPQSPDHRPKLVDQLKGQEGLSPAPVFPGVAQQAVNFVRSAVRHLAGGLKTTDEDEGDRRMQICIGCEYYQDGRCQKCGCYLKAKASWLSESCPVGKW